MSLSRAIFDLVPYIEREDYLARNIPDAPIKAVQSQIEVAIGRKLKFRKQSHLTIVTKPEFLSLKKLVGTEKLSQIVSRHSVQESKFTVLGLGRGVSGEQEVYYLVVESCELIKIRDEIAREFYSAGGSASAFDPQSYFPHITVAFTRRDLHQSDGVYKDSSTIIASVVTD